MTFALHSMLHINTISAALNSEEIGEDTLQELHLSHNSHKWQMEIDAQATEIAAVISEMNKAL